MASELSPDRDAILQMLVDVGTFPDRRRALDHAVDLLREEAETLDAIREGLASIERGEGVPFDEAVRELRQRLGIPERA
jgi:predicted transcriptional regulator